MMNIEELPIITKARSIIDLVKRGESFYKLSEYDQALKDFDKALDSNFQATIQEVLNYPVILFMTLMNTGVVLLGDYLLQLYKDMHYNRSNILIIEGHYEDALRHLDHLIKEFPLENLPETWKLKAKIYYLSKDNDRALYCLDKFIEYSPDDPSGYGLKGQFLFEAEKYNQALAWVNKALNKNANLDDLWLLKGNTHVALKEFDDALKSYHRALSINPKQTTALFNVAISYRNLYDYQKALTTLQRLLDITPDDDKGINLNTEIISILFKKGNLALNNKELDDALDYFRLIEQFAAAKPEPQEIKAATLNNIGNIIYEKDKDVTASLDYYNAALQINPDLNIAMMNKALRLVDLKRYSEATNCVEKSLELNPSNKEALHLKNIIQQPLPQKQKESSNKDLLATSNETMSGLKKGFFSTNKNKPEKEEKEIKKINQSFSGLKKGFFCSEKSNSIKKDTDSVHQHKNYGGLKNGFLSSKAENKSENNNSMKTLSKSSPN